MHGVTGERIPDIPVEFSNAFKLIRHAQGRAIVAGQCAAYWKDLYEYPLPVILDALEYFRRNMEDWPKVPTVRAKCYDLLQESKKRPAEEQRRRLSPKARAYAAEAMKQMNLARDTGEYKLWLAGDDEFHERHPKIVPCRFILDNWPAEGR